VNFSVKIRSEMREWLMGIMDDLRKSFHMQSRFLVFFLLTLCVTMAGCASFFPSVYQSGDLLIVDDFSSPNLEWNVWKRADGSTVGYYQEGLVFTINSQNTDYVSVLNSTYSDVRIETVARNLNGLLDNGFGVVCRYLDDSNYYAFLVSSDGYYGILRVLYGGYAVLNGGELQYSSVIAPGEATNHIRADCIGNQLTLYVNDVMLARVQDDVFSEGQIGLTASSFRETGVAVLFENFVAVYP